MCITKICFKYPENPSRKWTICWCLVCNPSDSRLTQTQFEFFTLVSEIHENVDLVLGIKNLFELEGVIDSCDSCFSFLNRSIPFSPKENTAIPPNVQKMVVIEAPCVEELSGMAMKVLDMNEHVTNMIKLKFIRNRATLKITNNMSETVTFDR